VNPREEDSRLERAYEGLLGGDVDEGVAPIPATPWEESPEAGARLPGWGGFFARPGVVAWTFLLPALAAFFVFSWLPLLRGLVLSFQDFGLVKEANWVGLDNYLRAMSDPQVIATLVHAIAFCALSLALGFWAPVALALYANELRRGRGLLKAVFFLPFLTPTVPAVLVWRWILDGGYGALNAVLSLGPWGPVRIPWLTDPALALLSLVLVFLWKTTGWNALIYQAALRDVPAEVYEIAELDGTGLWQRIRAVSLPILRPTMAFLLLMQVITTLQIFTEVHLLTGGGPANSTEMIATYMYKRSFLYLDIGYAAALGVLLFLALLGFTAARLRSLEES
jgi:multiple sugar transport system permease protein